jgi:Zn-dependent alcohol dehydrogenase
MIPARRPAQAKSSNRGPHDTLISRRYRLADINTGFADLLAGRNARSVIDHSL